MSRKKQSTPGSALEFDTEGLPYKASTDPDSPWYWPNSDVTVTVDGKKPAGCTGYDRRAGYVECMEVEGDRWWLEDGWPEIKMGEHGPIPVRRYGTIAVHRAAP
jgi:hypothetical protein